MKPVIHPEIQNRYAELKSRVAGLVEVRKQLTAAVRGLSEEFSEERSQHVIQARHVANQKVGQLIHELWPMLDELEAIDFEKAASVKRGLDQLIAIQRPLERTECDWETDRVLDLAQLLREIPKFFPFLPPEAEVPRAIADAHSPDFSPIPTPEGLSWSEVEVRFASEYEILVTIRGLSWTRRYEVAGFNDQRTGKPNSFWAMLRVFNQKARVPRPVSTKQIHMLEKCIQGLRKRLRRLISVDADPITWDRTDGGYRPNFKTPASRDTDK